MNDPNILVCQFAVIPVEIKSINRASFTRSFVLKGRVSFHITSLFDDDRCHLRYC
jgi:hypothetical protein